jgi:hypothetical protein
MEVRMEQERRRMATERQRMEANRQRMEAMFQWMQSLGASMGQPLHRSYSLLGLLLKALL